MERAPSTYTELPRNSNASALDQIRALAGTFSRIALRMLRLPISREAENLPEDDFLLTVSTVAASERVKLVQALERTQVRPLRELIEKLLLMGEAYTQHASQANGNGHHVSLPDPSELTGAKKPKAQRGRPPKYPQVQKRIPPDEMRGVWEAFKEDQSDEDLRNQLIENYLPIVKYSAERIWSRLPEGVELDDLMSAGVFGLMDAIDAYDLARGVKFETYCVPRIRGAMLDELRNMDWVPRLVRSKATKLNTAIKELETKLGRSPTEIELAGHLDMDVRCLEKMMIDSNAVGLISLNKKWYETDSYKDVREVDILADKKAPHVDTPLEQMDFLRILLRGLNRNERLIVILYYYEEMTMKEIGRTLGLSESRVSQMHSNFIPRIAESCKKHARLNDAAGNLYIERIMQRERHSD